MTDRPTHDDLEVMAAGVALGLLEGTERAEALRRQLEDPHFATRVRAWQERTDRWLEEVEPVEAPAGALSAIEHQLESRGANSKVPSISNDQGANKIWRSWAITATAASLLMAVGLGLAVPIRCRNRLDRCLRLPNSQGSQPMLPRSRMRQAHRSSAPCTALARARYLCGSPIFSNPNTVPSSGSYLRTESLGLSG